MAFHIIQFFKAWYPTPGTIYLTHIIRAQVNLISSCEWQINWLVHPTHLGTSRQPRKLIFGRQPYFKTINRVPPQGQVAKTWKHRDHALEHLIFEGILLPMTLIKACNIGKRTIIWIIYETASNIDLEQLTTFTES